MFVLFIQPFIPEYSKAFFEHLAAVVPVTRLKVMADISSAHQLNQLDDTAMFETANLTTRKWLGFEFKLGLFRRILKDRPDVCVLNATPRDLGALGVALLLRMLGVRVYFWGMFHRIGRQNLPTQIIYKTMSWIGNGLITYTEVGARNLISLGAPAHKVRIAGTAVDEQKSLTSKAKVTPQALERFRADMQLDDTFLILQVVRLSQIKKPWLLVDLACALKDQGVQNFKIVSIGGGDLFEDMQTRIQTAGVHNHITLLPAIYDEDILAHWFLAADVFTIPTCTGLSAHHALIYGVPIVTDNSLLYQASESAILQDGLNAILYNEGDIASYAKAIRRVVEDPEFREFLSQNAHRTVTETHNLARKTARFVQAISAPKS